MNGGVNEKLPCLMMLFNYKYMLFYIHFSFRTWAKHPSRITRNLQVCLSQNLYLPSIRNEQVDVEHLPVLKLKIRDED